MIYFDTNKSGSYITKQIRLPEISVFYVKKSSWCCRYNQIDGSKLVRINRKEFINLINKFTCCQYDSQSNLVTLDHDCFHIK